MLYFSPFKLKVRPKVEPDEVKIIGPITTCKGGVYASISTEFTVDASQAGVGSPDIQVLVCTKNITFFFSFFNCFINVFLYRVLTVNLEKLKLSIMQTVRTKLVLYQMIVVCIQYQLDTPGKVFLHRLYIFKLMLPDR